MAATDKNMTFDVNLLPADNNTHNLGSSTNKWIINGESNPKLTDTTYSAGNGISLTGTTFSNSGVRAITTGSSNGSLSVNTNGTVTNTYVKGIENGYLNIHPENTPIIIPFMHNDIAHLLKRGGSAIISYDGVTQSNLDLNPCFDGSESYWVVQGNINTIVIELTLFKVFSYTNTIYVDFGSISWRAKSIKIEAMNTNYTNDTWTIKLDATSNNSGHVTCPGAHTPNGASNAGGGFNKLRFTFSDFNSISTSGGSFRISQIGIYNFGSLGLRETYMSRGIDDSIFRNITPNDNNTYSLGSSTKKWSNVYATNFIGNLTGNVSGTATNITGTVAVDHGGTGSATAAGARTNLGITPGNIGAVATSEGVTAVTWDSTNKKLTRTINGTAADVVTIATIKTALGLAKADVGLGSVTNHAQVTSLQWDTTNKKLTYKVSEGTATNLLTFAAGSNISLTADTNKITIANTYSYSLPLAASGTRGGVQIGYTTDATNRNYAVQLSSEKMYVNVPWANTYTSSICTTGASTAAKTASSSNFVLKANTYIYLVMSNANTAQSALTLNINSTGAKPVWINGVVSSSTNYTWPAGSYLIYYDGTNYYVNTDGTVYGIPSIALGKSVPEMPFTDFDDIAIPSTYRIKNTATLKTIANSPLGDSSNSGGRIITMGGYTTTDNTYLRQFFFGSYYRMWIRGQAGTGTNLEWSPWVLMVTANPEGNVGDTNTPVYINGNGLALPATNVYNKNNIVYSSTAPANPTDGMIWLKPIS